MFKFLKQFVRLFNTERVSKLVFFVGFGLLTYVYGIATIYWEIFPYQTIRDARDAWEALANVEPDELPDGMLDYETQINPGPSIRRPTDGAGSEQILITGGFYELLDHCPNHGCMAWVIDRDGNVLHTWEADPNALLRGLTNVSGNISPMNFLIAGVSLLKDGGLIAVFHGRNTFPYQIGIAQFDVDGNVVWKRLDHSHHWPTVDEEGQIYVPYVKLVEGNTHFANTPTKLRCDTGPTLMEGVRIYAPDGTVEREFYLPDLFSEAEYPGLFFIETTTGNDRWEVSNCDPFHVNAVELVPDSAAAQLDNVNAGDLLVSMRTRSILAILDRNTGAIKHLISGRTSAQHSPRFLPDGTLLVFDNRGGELTFGGSRIVRIDLASNGLTTVFPKGDEGDLLPFYSSNVGVLSVSPNGKRVMISSTEQGRIIEIDIETGDVLWVYDKVLDMEPFHKAQNMSADDTHARFKTMGAYYVEVSSFLESRILSRD